MIRDSLVEVNSWWGEAIYGNVMTYKDGKGEDFHPDGGDSKKA